MASNSEMVGLLNGIEFTPMIRSQNGEFMIDIKFNELQLDDVKCIEIITSFAQAKADKMYYGTCDFIKPIEPE